MRTRFRLRLLAKHKAGMGTLQSVMILAVSAMVLLGMRMLWDPNYSGSGGLIAAVEQKLDVIFNGGEETVADPTGSDGGPSGGDGSGGDGSGGDGSGGDGSGGDGSGGDGSGGDGSGGDGSGGDGSGGDGSGGDGSEDPPLNVREMTDAEYRDALAKAKTFEEVYELSTERHADLSRRQQMMNAQTDVIRARRQYFDRQFETHKQAGRTLKDLTREELKALHRYPLVEADQFFEGYLRAEDNGAGFAMEMIYIYNRKKITDWNSGRLVIATDSDGRSYSPPGNGQYRAGLQGVSMAVEEGRTAVHGLSATQQMNQIITMLDVLLGSNR